VRATILARVSTEAQATEDKASVDTQLREDRAAAVRLGAVVVKEIVIPGHSANYRHLHQIVRDSPDFAELVRHIEAGETDVLICWAWSRIGRTMDLTMELGAVCDESYVQIYPVTAPTRIVPPDEFRSQSRLDDKLMRGVQGWQSEKENAERAARTKFGKERRVRDGRYMTSGLGPPYGYAYGDGGALVPDPTEATWLRWIFERRAADRWGYNRIARELTARGVPTRRNRERWVSSTVRGIVANPIYAGHVRWGGEYSEHGVHPLLIDAATWAAVQAVNRMQTQRHSRERTGRGVLRGMLRCGYCGGAMLYVLAAGPRGKPSLRCSRYVGSGGSVCRCNNVPQYIVEGQVLADVTGYLMRPEAVLEAQAASGDAQAVEMAELTAGLVALEQRWQRWNGAYESGVISGTELQAHRERISAEMATLQRRRREIEDGETAQRVRYETWAELRGLVGRLAELSPERLRYVYHALVAEVTVTGREVRVTYL
jgi:DNA invertase Pin-like site-specific DNA recombinase